MSEPTLAERLLTKLRELRDTPSYPLPLTAVAQQALPEADAAALKKLFGDKKLKPQLQLSVKNKPEAPAALAEDADRLFASDALLTWLLDALRGKKWTVPFDKLAAKVSPEGKDRFLQAVEQRRQEGRWPEGVEVTVEDPLTLGLTAHKPPPPPPKPPKPEVALAQRLVDLMRQQRERGGDAYPLSLAQLVALIEPPDPKVFNKAVKDAAFTSAIDRWTIAPLAPLVLVGDEERLIDSDNLVRYLVGSLSSKKKALFSPEDLVQVWRQAEQPRLLESLRRRLEENRIPDGLGVVRLGDLAQFFAQANPPAADWLLATRMQGELARRRAADAANYATPLRTLAEAAAPNTEEKVLKAALKQAALKNVVPGVKGSLDAPAAFKEDDAQLAQSEPLLLFLIESGRTDADHALKLGDVKKKLDAGLKGRFEDAVQARLKEGTLSPLVGTLRIKKDLYLFLRRDINRGAEEVQPPPAPTPPIKVGLTLPPFDEAFEEAFTRLNAARGNVNQVSLVDLRRELAAYPIELFEAGLMSLRRNGHFTLSQAEGQITPEEQQAAIREDGSLLLHVSRRL